MLVEVKRDVIDADYTHGDLFIDGILICETLELPVRDGLPGSAIPPTGNTSYLIKLQPSPKFMASSDPWTKSRASTIPHILGIPNRSDILIHWGNTPHDTNGCILVGLVSTDPGTISQSRSAYAIMWMHLNAAVHNGETIQLKVYGGTPHTPADLSMQGDV